MTSAETHAAITLKEIRRNVIADSALFGNRLTPAPEMPGSEGYSDLFMDACGSDSGESFNASRSGGSVSKSKSEAAGTIRLGIEYIFEGYLLHYGESRLLGPEDANFQLLAGDYMYARGLEAIARLEDLACVEALAELVRLCSFIHCEKLEPELAAKAWAVTTLGLAARISSGVAAPLTALPAFGDLEKLHELFEELITASEGDSIDTAGVSSNSGDSGGSGENESDPGSRNSGGSGASGDRATNRSASLRERFSNIEAEFFHIN